MEIFKKFYFFRSEWLGTLTGIHRKRRKSGTKKASSDDKDDSKKYNVLIIVLDAISRFAGEHALPSTLAYMKGALQAAVFKHHTVLGGYSFTNVIPMLTGSA